MVEDNQTLIYQGNKNPITNMKLDEINNKLWFTSTNDSSLRCMDLNKVNLDKFSKHLDGVGGENEAVAPTQADFELQGLPWITEYHMLKNKRYVITNNS
jgi:hypothetical protein